MRTKQEILDHLATTYYSRSARKSIIAYLMGAGISTDGVKFAERNSNNQYSLLSAFGSFIAWVTDGNNIDIVSRLTDLCRQAVCGEEFKVGDWVKYMPVPAEYSTETIVAIAHDDENGLYLCLSNGEWVRPCYCVRYKVQGEERISLLDKLNAIEI